MNSKAQLEMNLGETYLVTETGNERLEKIEVESGHIVGLVSSLIPSLPNYLYQYVYYLSSNQSVLRPFVTPSVLRTSRSCMK